LWEAQDNATNSLMQYFYRHLSDGQDKASALREAKVDFLEEYGRTALPYYWAGLVMIGEGAGTIASLSTKP
jgi:CHAT domain-containing protein